MNSGQERAHALTLTDIAAPPPRPFKRTLRSVDVDVHTPLVAVPSATPSSPGQIGTVLGPTAGMLSHLTLASMAVFSVAVVAPTAALDIGVPAAAIGIYVSAVYGFGVLSGLFTGSLVARYGAVRTCQATMALVAFAMAALVIAHPLAAVASAVLLGLAYGMLNPASARILSSVAGRRLRPLIFSVKQSGVPLGGVLAGVAIPLLVVSYGWKAALLAVGCLALVTAAGCQSLRARFDMHERRTTVPSVRSLAEPLGLVWRSQDLRTLSIMSVAYAGCQICLGSFFVIFFITRTNLTLIDAGIAFTALQMGGFVGRLAWGAAAERLWSSWAVLTAMGALMAANLCVLIVLDAAWPSWLHALVGFSLGATCYGWNGVFFSEIARRAPDNRCEDATGAVQSIMFAGIVVFPPMFAATVALSGGFTLAFASMAVMVSAAAVLGWINRFITNRSQLTESV